MTFDPAQIHLDPADSLPLYQQIERALAAAIESGDLPASTRLPATRPFAKQLGVNRVTVVTAYAELAAEGYIASHVGRGAFVLDRIARAETPLPPSLRQPGDWSAHNFNREMMRLAQRPDIISFAPGMPATDLLPADAYRLALNTVLRRDGPEILQYGLYEGYMPLQDAIVAELAGFGITTGRDRLFLTSGTEQGLALVMRTVLQAGDRVLVEQPTYMHALDLLSGSGIEAHSLPCDDHGPRVDLLAGLLAELRPRLLYLTPTFHNPTGVTMPLERRQYLLRLAAEHDLLLLEDDVYRHLWLDEPPSPPLRALDAADNVIYTNGYSKCLLPGARIGYVVAPARLRARLAAAHQTLDVTPGELHQRALHHYLQGAQFVEHLHRLRAAQKKRRDALIDALATYMPQDCTWSLPGGGLYLWLKLPEDGPSATSLYVHALELGVAFAPGHLFYLNQEPGASHSLRLNFVLHPPAVIADGIRRLGNAWKQAAGNRP
ncbi:MAG: PLP-dependent aminotransferase family protein [Caldilineales bacterium]|nr:PLP-dependent aminotransferase family protein [Caldilineales bacterium]